MTEEQIQEVAWDVTAQIHVYIHAHTDILQTAPCLKPLAGTKSKA